MKMQIETSGTEVSPRFRKRKWVLRVAAGSAVVVAMAAGSVALFSDTKTSSTNSFDAGTVSVGLGSTSTTCTIDLLMPDDSSAGFGSGSQSKSTCTYAVKYTGTVDAWLAADVLVETGTPSLYTGTSNGLQYKVKVAGGPTLVNGTTFTSEAGSNTQVDAGSSVSNMLLSSNPAVEGDELEERPRPVRLMGRQPRPDEVERIAFPRERRVSERSPVRVCGHVQKVAVFRDVRGQGAGARFSSGNPPYHAACSPPVEVRAVFGWTGGWRGG